MSLYVFEGRRPVVGRSSYIHDSAVVIGRVSIGESCFIGAGAVLRGDWGEIQVGDGSNVQENAVLHAAPEMVTHLSRNSHIGHLAILHGCYLEEHVLVGMGAIINDGARIGADSLIASGAVVSPGTLIPPRSLAMGVPARVVRELSEQQLNFTRAATMLYQTLATRYPESLEEISLDDCRG
jgi:carbonic anhydrase/acetyltransferase-like protein (isoleucine patch superfamily)